MSESAHVDVVSLAVGPAPPAVGRETRRRRRWPAALAVLAGVFGVGLVALPRWLESDAGRAAIARTLEKFVSDGIRGSLRIGGIDAISADGVVGHDVRFTDESGRLVLEADEVELDVDWSELFLGHVVSSHGRVRGARVVLETLRSGTLLADRAFESSDPGPPGQPIGADVVRLEGLVVSGVDLLVAVHGAPDIRARHLSAIVLVRAPEHGGAHLRADRIDAEVHIDAPLPIDLSVEDGTLTLDGDSRRRVVFALPTRMNGEALELDGVARADRSENLHVALHIIPSGLGATLVSAPLWAQALLGEASSDVLDVTVEGP